nr:PKD domain-containing protein [Bacteroidia bacterium]
GDTVIISNPDPDFSYTLIIESGPDCDIALTPSVAAYIPDVQFSYTPDCYQNVTFTNSSNTNSSINYNWDFGDGTSGNTVNPIHHFASAGNYTVSLHAHDTSNCKSSISQIIPVYGPPKIDFENEKACIYQPCKFTGIISDPTLPPYNFEWYFDGSFTENTMWMEHTFDIPGIHAVQLVVEDGNGCIDTLTGQVNVADFNECEIGFPDHFIPNAFTPNGDGINDNFEISISGQSASYRMEIFNRFGELVFSGLRWNGTGNNQKCPGGIYSYRIHIKNNRQLITKSGIVNLIR